MKQKTKAQTQTGARALRAIFADAQRAIDDDAALLAPDPDANLPRDGVKPGRWEGAPFDAWPDCGVRIVGRDADGLVYAISTTGHLRRLEKYDMPTLADLFAPRLNTMMFHWPAFGKEKKRTDPESGEEVKMPPRVERVERDKCMMAIVNEAARKPDFDPDRQHRGRGGWEDRTGNFIWHSGGWLWRPEGKRLARSRPMEHEGYLYTRMPATIEPWSEPVAQEESPAVRALEDLRTWNWERPYLDPILVLGWLATAIMGGALRYRPVIFTTGGAGVGKSRLQELVNGVLAGVVTTSVNTTAAGIYQRAKRDSLPFLIDELESKPGSSRAESVIELARVAYSGGDISRGGQDHEATTFTARQSFFFSAINPPPMGAQDKSRMAVLNLGRLKIDPTKRRDMVLSPETDGRMLLRQVMDGWSDFRDRTLPYYAGILNEHGLSARAIDTFGTLLAAAELLVGQAVLEDIGLPVTDPGHLGNMVAAATAIERAEQLENWHACLDRLLQSSIDSWKDGVKPTVGGICERMLLPQSHSDFLEARFARMRLELVGLGAIDAGKNKHAPQLGPCLAIPADGPMLGRIFADTEWHGGVWFHALKQCPDDIVIRSLGNGQKVKINGSTKHCLLVDLAAFEKFSSGD